MLKLPALMTALQQSWNKHTSHYPNWTPENPASGQCAVTALIVQDYFGGDIISCFVGNKRHYFNDFGEEGKIDLTASQFKNPKYESCKIVDRKQLLRNSLVKVRYELLAEKVRGVLNGKGFSRISFNTEGTETGRI